MKAIEGLIPAHAGSTLGRGSSPRERAAHPRSRGEHAGNYNSTECKNGSSPLTRGAPWLASFSIAATRLIPAHAGSTFMLAYPPLR